MDYLKNFLNLFFLQVFLLLIPFLTILYLSNQYTRLISTGDYISVNKQEILESESIKNFAFEIFNFSDFIWLRDYILVILFFLIILVMIFLFSKMVKKVS